MINKDSYYNPPPKWSFESIVARYQLVNNNENWEYAISFESVKKYPELIRIKKALQMISLELKSNDPGAIDICVSLVSSQVYFHYSGYIRATMARRLKSCKLTNIQVLQLVKGLEMLFENNKVSYEFKELKALLIKVKNDH